MIAGPTSMFQEAGLSLPHSWLAAARFCNFCSLSHTLDNILTHPQRGHSNRNEVGLKRYIFVLQWTEK